VVEYNVPFIDVDPTLGATATRLFEYLVAAEVTINPPLATALVYAIITDTANLSRESSTRDFLAFTTLWPMADSHALAAMSRPRLSRSELDFFVSAIWGHHEIADLNFAWLGRVEEPDIIPRLADFALQFGDHSWSAVAGIHQERLHISFRYAGIEGSAGELAARLFGDIGSAGGHKSMAKAVVPLSSFCERENAANDEAIRERLIVIFSNAFDSA
jgi:nanoRNase/pAp phosphatase (c-di-AMP/oligoRNAs hydrolase)